jgi:glycosyltransferase involved in cell wall biosynthesis
MKLSVLMSVYAKESAAFLRDCLKSLAAQTQPADELVLVEDGPVGDELRQVIELFRDRLTIRSVRLPSNEGLGEALRQGLAACRGEFIARMDADDICAPERFGRQLQFLEEHPEVEVVGSAIAEFDTDWMAPHSVRRLPACGEELLRMARMRTPLNHQTVMFRRDPVMAAGSYQSCHGFEDYHLWARMLVAGARLHNLAEPMVYARCGNGMQERRGGWDYMRREISAQFLLRRIGLITSLDCLRNILARSPLRLAPSCFRVFFYRAFLRTRYVPPRWIAQTGRSWNASGALPPALKASPAAESGNRPLVSIITPVYNAGRWLSETLESVAAQSFRDWEHILVDDWSTDDSCRLLEAAAARDSRIRVLRMHRNIGSPQARNLALDAARGRYIAFLDADDLWHPEKLSRSLSWMQEHAYEFTYHDYRHISHDGKQVGALVKGPEELNMRSLHTRRGTGCLTVVLDRHKIAEFRFPNLKRPYRAEDFCLWLSLIQRGYVGHRLPLDLARYRLSKNSRSANKLKGALNAWRLYRNFSRLSFLNAALWWIQYAWNDFWLYQYARPR